MSREKLAYAQEYCHKRAGLALHGVLWPNCRVGVAVSGGVDSFTLLKVMLLRQKILPFSMEILALHLNPGFEPENHAALAPWLAEAGVVGHIETTDYGPRAHSPENRKNSPCFYCARLRRKRLFDLCAQYKLTHLAFGHNGEDLQTTFMLNLLRNAKVQGLRVSESFFNGSLRVIRPLLFVEKKHIRQAARQWNLPVWQNACPSAGQTARSEMERTIAKICADLPNARKSLLAGLSRWELEKKEKSH